MVLTYSKIESDPTAFNGSKRQALEAAACEGESVTRTIAQRFHRGSPTCGPDSAIAARARSADVLSRSEGRETQNEGVSKNMAGSAQIPITAATPTYAKRKARALIGWLSEQEGALWAAGRDAQAALNPEHSVTCKRALAEELATALPGEPVAIYAGAGKSGIFRDGHFASVEREDIKTAVKQREIRLLVATDAACEGLNLQTLGTLINVDLPWNPSRLEQRLGRIKRFGQVRKTVDMLNLVYHDTQDEDIYDVISRRMKDRYDIFGSLPDTIEDDWIENVEELKEKMDEYIHLRDQARNAFEVRYQESIDPDKDRWELCSRVLARRDIVDMLSSPW